MKYISFLCPAFVCPQLSKQVGNLMNHYNVSFYVCAAFWSLILKLLNFFKTVPGAVLTVRHILKLPDTFCKLSVPFWNNPDQFTDSPRPSSIFGHHSSRVSATVRILTVLLLTLSRVSLRVSFRCSLNDMEAFWSCWYVAKLFCQTLQCVKFENHKRCSWTLIMHSHKAAFDSELNPGFVSCSCFTTTQSYLQLSIRACSLWPLHMSTYNTNPWTI